MELRKLAVAFVLCVTTICSLINTAYAQDVEHESSVLRPDPEVLSGFQLVDRYPVTTPVAQGSETRKVIGESSLYATATSEFTARLQVTCLVGENPEDATRLLEQEKRGRQGFRPLNEEDAPGDRAFSNGDGSAVCWIQGRIVIFIVVSITDFDKRLQYAPELINAIVDHVEDKASRISGPNIPDFQVELEASRTIFTQGDPLALLSLSVLFSDGATNPRWSAEIIDSSGASPLGVELTTQRQAVLNLSMLETGTYTLLVTGFDDISRRDTRSLEITVAPSSSQDTALHSSQDTLLCFRDPHQNEGQNTHLTLEKVQGKPTRFTVAFDMNDINFNGLSRATLILTVDSNQAVNGWGNGRTISAQTITQPWKEGNGWHFGLKNKDQITGNGSGATWFSPADEDISNESANSVVNWNGATSSVYPPTAPAVQINNFQSGEVAFDVTADVLNGAENGWLILKNQENVGSKVSFYSREGAAAAGNPDLAPRLILEFGGPVASEDPHANSFLAQTGLGSIGTKLRTSQNGNELRSVREVLQDNPMAALATEQLLYEATRTSPVLNITTRTAYRSWLAEDLRIAAVPVRFV